MVRRADDKCVYSTEARRQHLSLPDVDILGVAGFARFVQHIQRARKAVHIQWEDFQSELDGGLPPDVAEVLARSRPDLSSTVSVPALLRPPHSHVSP